jgi:hypothetical protein
MRCCEWLQKQRAAQNSTAWSYAEGVLRTAQLSDGRTAVGARVLIATDQNIATTTSQPVDYNWLLFYDSVSLEVTMSVAAIAQRRSQRKHSAASLDLWTFRFLLCDGSQAKVRTDPNGSRASEAVGSSKAATLSGRTSTSSRSCAATAAGAVLSVLHASHTDEVRKGSAECSSSSPCRSCVNVSTLPLSAAPDG